MRPVPRHSHKRKSSRDRTSSQDRQLANKRIPAERREVREFKKIPEQDVVHVEQQARLIASLGNGISCESTSRRSKESINYTDTIPNNCGDEGGECSAKSAETTSFSRYGAVHQKSRLRCFATGTSPDARRITKPRESFRESRITTMEEMEALTEILLFSR